MSEMPPTTPVGSRGLANSTMEAVDAHEQQNVGAARVRDGSEKPRPPPGSTGRTFKPAVSSRAGLAKPNLAP